MFREAVPIFLFMERGLKHSVYRVNFSFSKQGVMRYISHRDLMRLLMRAARRSALPLYYTKGFSPHIKLSMNRALKLGLESECERAAILLTRKLKLHVFVSRLNKQLPKGINIKEASYL